MTMVRFGNVQFGLMLAMGLSVSMGSTPSHAYTPEQEQACTSDAFRLCSSEIPNVDRVTACMVAKKSQLSPPCRAQFRSGPEPGEAAAAPAGQPISIRPASGRKKPAGTKPASTKPRKPKPKPKPKKPKPATT